MADRLQVLAVDDEPKMRLGMARALRDFVVELPDFGRSVRFEVSTAETGEQALAHIAANPVDILLLDHKLPGMQGLEVLQKVTEDKLDMVVVMVTAYASIATAVSAGKQGAFDFLAKPFTPSELKDTIEKATTHLIVQRKARQLERERHQMRYQLISVVAHELKSPLNAIDSYLQLINDPELKLSADKITHIVDRSHDRLEGMRKLINDLLDLTRIESGQKKRNLVTVDLTQVTQEPVEDAIELGREHAITVETEMPPSLLMEADEGELRIILNNLLSNAVKYNRDGGKVILRVADLGDQVSIAVTDTGIGLTQAEADRLFGEFVRIRNKKTRGISGSGLGLSILQKLAHLYKGRVDLRSEPDVGSTFTVYLHKHTQVELAESIAAED